MLARRSGMTITPDTADWFGAIPAKDGYRLWPFKGRDFGTAFTAQTLPQAPTLLAADHSLPADKTPCPLLPHSLEARGQLRVVPNISQASPVDRIGAARIAAIGFQDLNPEWDGILIIVGDTTTTWVHVSAKEVISLASTLTPQLAATLAPAAQDLDTEALSDTFSRPERLATHLRSAEVTEAADRTLGHLIGADLAATRAYWLGQDLALIADGPLAKAYQSGLKAQHAPATLASYDRMTAQGFRALAKLAKL